MSIADFVAQYQGQKVDDGHGNYPGECVSLCKRWLEANGWPLRRGNAINWQYNGTPPYQWIANRPWNKPSPGDIVVFRVGPYGHIGICVSATAWSMQVFSQNWPTGNDTDPARVTTFNYVRPPCIGWLHHT